MLEKETSTLDKQFTNVFGSLDYVLFVATLVVSAAIGVYFAIKDRKSRDVKDFLLGGGKIHVVPVTLSLLASFMSSLTLLGTPAEMYKFGTMFFFLLDCMFSTLITRYMNKVSKSFRSVYPVRVCRNPITNKELENSP